MKLLISFSAMLLSLNLYSKALIVISYEKGLKSNAKAVQAIFIEKHRVPKNFILIKEGCSKTEDVIAICLSGNGLMSIDKKNRELLSSLQIFNRSY